MSKINRLDILIMVIITLIFGVVSFWNLGDMNAPKTAWAPNVGDVVVISLPENTHISRIQYFLGARTDKNLEIALSDDGEIWCEQPLIVRLTNVFAWSNIAMDDVASYIRLRGSSNELFILEMAIRDYNDNIVQVQVDEAGQALFDEQHLVPLMNTFMNSTYFDEIYHPRTAYEFIHQMDVLEWSHPPLGKAIIACGVLIFGMNPFGWRFMGTLFGVLMLPLLYIFAKHMFKHPFWATFATLLFAADFMRFAQTRLATIDTYIVFFVIAMYYYMYKYISEDFTGAKPAKLYVPLALSGLTMGLGIASKWPGVYAAIGLAIIFFIHLVQAYLQARRNDSIPQFGNRSLKIIAWCLLCFVAIPVLVYGLSYIPFIRTPGREGLSGIWENQMQMFNYHANLDATHGYSSLWWQWPLMTRPILYYARTMPDGLKSGISSFGNPLVWYVGVLAFFYTAWEALKQIWNSFNLQFKFPNVINSKVPLFITIGALAQFLPWIPVTRVVFIYHFFPVVPFLILATTYMFKRFADAKLHHKYITPVVYLLAAFVLFIMFYPVLAGVPVSEEYVSLFLRWLSSWVLVI